MKLLVCLRWWSQSCGETVWVLITVDVLLSFAFVFLENFLGNRLWLVLWRKVESCVPLMCVCPAATSSSVRGGQQRSGVHLSCGSGPRGSGQGCGGRIPCGSLQAGSAAWQHMSTEPRCLYCAVNWSLNFGVSSFVSLALQCRNF